MSTHVTATRLLPIVSCIVAMIAAQSLFANTPDRAALDKIAKLSVPFVPNAGQWDARAAFAAQTFAGTLFVTKQGELVYSLPGKPIHVGAGSTTHGEATVGADLAAQGRSHEATPSRRLHRLTERSPGWVLSETLVDAQGQPRAMAQSTLKAPAGYRPMEGKVSYAIGNDPSKHADNLNTYERVNLGDMYPGVNVQLRAVNTNAGNNVEKIFTVAPKHDPNQINIKLAGAEKLEIGAQGELIAHTGNGPVSFTAPIAFQDTAAGERVSVAVAYTLSDAGSVVPTIYGFTLGRYDENLPLVIDPLLQSTYLGGSNSEVALALAVHPSSGDIYIAGYSGGTDLPGIVGGAQEIFGGGFDAFVTRFNASLTTRIQTSYVGGSGNDIGYALAIHPISGEVFVAGSTDSAAFPGALGGAQNLYGGASDGFVTRFNDALTSRLQSSYVGGSSADIVSSLAIAPASGEVFVAGWTSSTDLPGALAGAQASVGGSNDAFITRFNATLTARLQSTYAGGTSDDYALAIAIHPSSGEIYVAGYTDSTNVPGIFGGAQNVKSGGIDALVVRFNAALTTRLQATYLGGANSDVAYALAIHPASGEVYVAGSTNTSDFPGIGGGAQSASNGLIDAFVTRFNAALTARLQSTLLSGSSGDIAYAIAVHPLTGEVIVAGSTSSADLPGTNGGARNAFGGGSTDAFASRLSASLTARLQSTYLGGSGADVARAVAIHPASGDVVLAGSTTSSDLPNANGSTQSSAGGSDDAFLARFSSDLALDDQSPNPFAFVTQGNVPTASARTSNPVLISGIGASAPIYVAGAFASSYCVSSANNCSCDISGGFVTANGTINNNRYVCVRHTSAPYANAATTTVLHVGTGAATFLTKTGTSLASCNLDIDGSGGAPNAASDGLMLVRAMLGFTGTNVITGAIVGTPPRNTWAQIRTYLNDNCGTSFLP